MGIPRPHPAGRSEDIEALRHAEAEARFAAEVAREQVRALQRDRDSGKEHVRHALACVIGIEGGCQECRVADTWRRA